MNARAILVSLRPHQWTKNLVVFAALGFSKHLFELGPLARATLAFTLFCGLSGAVYLLNDLADLQRDRLHPLGTCLVHAVLRAALRTGHDRHQRTSPSRRKLLRFC